MSTRFQVLVIRLLLAILRQTGNMRDLRKEHQEQQVSAQIAAEAFIETYS